jgi:catechol 2,3-dioxygenase-like lactoylglutathione lyase family enzyme
MAMLGLGHVGIYVHDLERMVAFYRNTLGITHHQAKLARRHCFSQR